MENIINMLEKSEVGKNLVNFAFSWKGIVIVVIVVILTVLNKKDNNFIELKDIEGFIKKSKK
jgi:hypothetical protein